MVQLKVYIDDVLLATGNYETADAHTIQVPQDKQRGCYIHFEVSGTGEVYEIEYEAGGSKNGQ